MEKLGITVSLTSVLHTPQTNGQLETTNQEIVKFLRTFCANNQED